MRPVCYLVVCVNIILFLRLCMYRYISEVSYFLLSIFMVQYARCKAHRDRTSATSSQQWTKKRKQLEFWDLIRKKPKLLIDEYTFLLRCVCINSEDQQDFGEILFRPAVDDVYTQIPAHREEGKNTITIGSLDLRSIKGSFIFVHLSSYFYFNNENKISQVLNIDVRKYSHNNIQRLIRKDQGKIKLQIKRKIDLEFVKNYSVASYKNTLYFDRKLF